MIKPSTLSWVKPTQNVFYPIVSSTGVKVGLFFNHAAFRMWIENANLQFPVVGPVIFVVKV